jgi:hypothetical protein
VFLLAKNCGTSVEMIEKWYADVKFARMTKELRQEWKRLDEDQPLANVIYPQILTASWVSDSQASLACKEWEGAMDWQALVAAFLGGLASGWTLKFVVDARRITKTVSTATRDRVTQVGNTVGGDMAGGDIRKKS